MSRTRIQQRPASVVEVLETAQLREQVRQHADTISLLSEELAEVGRDPVAESFSDLERQLFDPGWIRLSAQFEQEFTAEGLRQVRAICRLFAVKNPLVRRGLSLRGAYVWASGVEITARANGKKRREQDVQAVVEAFLSDGGNSRAFTGGAARERLERCLGTDGEFFPTLFTRPTTGEVQVRVVGADEITEIICNPQDRSEPWYYRRMWVQRTLNPDGHSVDQQMEQFHPHIDYQPRNKPKAFGRIPVAWDAPMLHVKVNDLEGWQRGIPDAYAAIDWAMAYKIFLEDWARLVKALSKFAWRLTAKGATRTQARTKLAAAPPRDAAGNVLDVGATAITPPDQILEAIPKSGATIDSESGKPLAAMIAAALDVPLTMLLADPGQTGARAVAETLDKPIELAMSQRRDLWAGVYQRILRYVIAEAVRAPDGPLKGTVTTDVYGRETVKLNGNTDPTVDIDWPDLSANSSEVIASAVNAASTGVIPPEQLARLLLTALGVKHVDTIVEAMVDGDGNFQWPEGPPVAVPAPPSSDPNSTSPLSDPNQPVDGPPADAKTKPATATK